jgi:hypothetical protein
VSVRAVQRPATQICPSLHPVSLVHEGDGDMRHVPSMQTVPEAQSVLVRQLPGFGTGCISVGATHTPLDAPASLPEPPRQVHPRGQSVLLRQLVVQPRLVQICPVEHS